LQHAPGFHFAAVNFVIPANAGMTEWKIGFVYRKKKGLLSAK